MARSFVSALCLAAICGEVFAGRRGRTLDDTPSEFEDNTPVTLSRRATCQNGVSGKIANAQGPVKAATVLKVSPVGKTITTVLSRKDGTFVVPATPGETYSVVIRKYGHFPQNITWAALQSKAVPGCPYAYTTNFNLTALTFCNSKPCKNGGSCLQDENGFFCKCTSGFYPPTCNTTTQPVTPIDGRNDRPCADDPCRNGGACTANGTSYTCTCIIGFSGYNCEEQDNTVAPDYCFPNPCLNNGACANLPGEVPYKCTCTADWIGPSCEAPAISSICDTNPCQNGGGCRRPFADPNKFVCLCPIGYTGQTCEEVIDFCNPNPCRSGGLCTRTRAGFLCTCQGGWAGKFCTIPPSVCLKNGPCMKGVCKVNPDTGAPVCVCYNNYGGAFCDIALTYRVGPCLVRNAAKSSALSLSSVSIVLRDTSGKIYQRTSGPTQHGGFDWELHKWIFYNFTYVESAFDVPAGTYVVVASAPSYRESVSSRFTVYKGWKGCPETVLRKV